VVPVVVTSPVRLPLVMLDGLAKTATAPVVGVPWRVTASPLALSTQAGRDGVEVLHHVGGIGYLSVHQRIRHSALRSLCGGSGGEERSDDREQGRSGTHR
jgi:hypothetical protein